MVRQTSPVNYEIQMGKGKLKKAYAGRLKAGKRRNDFSAQRKVEPQKRIVDEYGIEAKAKISHSSGSAESELTHGGCLYEICFRKKRTVSIS